MSPSGFVEGIISMKHDKHADAELLEVIELAKQFLDQEKKRGLEQIRMRPETLEALRPPRQE